MEQTITKKEALEYIKQNIGRCNLSSFNIGTTYVDDEKKRTEYYSIFTWVCYYRGNRVLRASECSLL